MARLRPLGGRSLHRGPLDLLPGGLGCPHLLVDTAQFEDGDYLRRILEGGLDPGSNVARDR